MGLDEHVIELLPAYALDCLEAGQISQVADHLATCEICRAELRGCQSVSDRLGLAAPAAEPRPDIKKQLMKRIQASARPAGGQTGKLLGLQRMGEWMRKAAPVWSLASLVLVAILLASNLLLWRQVNQLRMSDQAAMRVIALDHTQAAPGATGLIVISMDGEHGTLVVDRLPVLEEKWQYQLWLIKDGQRTSGGVFSVGEDGYGSVWVKAPEPLASYPAFGVTVEPAGGSPGPTGEKVLGGEL